MLYMFFFEASGEEQMIIDTLELEEMQQIAAENGLDISDILAALISGDVQSARDMLPEVGKSLRGALTEDIAAVSGALLVPVLTEAALKLVLGKSTAGGRTARFVCRAGAVAALANLFVRQAGAARSLMTELLRCSDACTPVMIAAVALSGAETTATVLTPMSSLCANIIQNVLAEWGIALSAAAAAIAVAGNLTDGIRLKRLHSLFRQFLYWTAGLLMAMFMGALSIQGRLVAGRDTTAARTARFAIESIVPVVGGNISDSLDSLLSAAFLVKNAVGVCGMLMLIMVCLMPIVRIAGVSALLRLISAVTEPLGDSSMTAMIGQFSEAVEMLLVTCAAALALCMMLAGSCLWAAGNIVR